MDLGIWLPLQAILQGRLLLELVPDEYRNAVYSLIPSLILLVSVPLLTLGGFVISSHGFSAGILLIIVLELISATILGLGLYWLEEPKPKSIELPTQEESIETSAEETPAKSIG
ncbi:MAG: hypothetical protein ACE5OZ_16285 [Candidatus Heimdallarchaeota archaeon]